MLNLWYEKHRKQKGKENILSWITLDERDNDPSRFWSAVWSSLRRGQEKNAVDLSIPLYSTPQMPIESVLAALLNSKPRGVLILDDYHAITNPQIHESMELLLTHLPPDLHILLSSRSEPPLSLGRARMYGELLELHVDDLRLSESEIAWFLHEAMGLSLSAEEQTLLEQRTEGWIAGLYLAALALREQQPGEVLSRFTGSQRSLFDYFAEEVFARQSAEIQQFLLSTALLPELTPQLCAAVFSEDGQDCATHALHLLEYCARANLFVVSLDEQRHCYRYHALFSEFLQAKLQQSTPPSLIATLRRRAAGWYEQQGLIEEAIENALVAGDNERAIRLIERIGEEILWRKGEVRRLLSWLRQIPSLLPAEHPRLAILYAWALLLSGQQDLEDAEALLLAVENSAEETVLSSLQGDIAALRARLAAFHNDVPQALAFSRQALQALPKERALLRADVAFGLSGTYVDPDEAYRMLSEALHISQALGSLRTAMFSSRYLAANCIEQGRMTEAEAILRQALHLAGDTEHRHVPAAGVIHIGLAELLYERNELSEALRHVLLGIELGERSGEIKVLLSGYCVLAQIHAASGEIERGWQELWKAERVALVGKVSWLREQRASVAIHLALLQKDIGAAQRALHAIEIDSQQTIEHLPLSEHAGERCTLARVWLAEEKYSAVLELLEPLVRAAQEKHRIRTLLSAQTLQAMALSALNKRQQAIQLISSTLDMAGPEGYLRVFLDAGEPLLQLLQKMDVTGGTRVYLRKLLDVSESVTGARKYNNGGLSEREYEVLQLLAAGMSNQEIADTLVVAISTAKAHVKHLCQKLGVQTRIQAVAKARAMELL